MGNLVYDARTEREYEALHGKVLEFLEPVAAERRIPTLIEVYGGTGPDWSARSNRKPTRSSERLLSAFADRPGICLPEERTVIVNGVLQPDEIEGIKAHETSHAVVGRAYVPIVKEDAIPGTFGGVAQKYLQVWDAAREQAGYQFFSLGDDVPWLDGFVSGGEAPEIEMGELYSELAANYVHPGYFPGRERHERQNLAHLGEFRKMLMGELDCLAEGRADSAFDFRVARGMLDDLLGTLAHVPAWAAARLLREYGSAQEAVRRNPAIFSLDKEEVWDYLSNLEVD